MLPQVLLSLPRQPGLLPRIRTACRPSSRTALRAPFSSRATGNPLRSTSRVREVPPPRCSNHLLIGLGAVGLNAVALQGVAPHDLKLLLLVYPCELLFHNRYRVGPIPVVVRKVT